jgi:hypothetical protein
MKFIPLAILAAALMAGCGNESQTPAGTENGTSAAPVKGGTAQAQGVKPSQIQVTGDGANVDAQTGSALQGR